ncbi:uncharacterized protein LOC134234551 [Saccostrea cucullata]|uniref:uncharacterized protein LOC134234551 n=1 Tax=Saccostrea cuccullata TaxID=36930 RepID=UPI002ED134F0
MQTKRPSSATHITRVKHVEQTHVPTDISVSTAKSNTQELNAPNSPQVTKDCRPKLPTPVRPEILKTLLEGYNSSLSELILSGFTTGFRLGCLGTPTSQSSSNHGSTNKHPQVVLNKILKEQKLGRISEPSPFPQFENLVTSPLGVVPKKVEGQFRLIHDLSFPENNSVNSQIPPENSQVSYDSIDNIISLVRQFGSAALMAKCDIEDGFRNIPIHPEDYHLLGFKWENFFYYDKCLPMGASSSCKIFEMLSTALQWIMLNYFSAKGMSHMIDDFFFIGPPASDSCLTDLNNFISLCDKIGIPLNPNKTCLPNTNIIIYGIEVDSIAMECRLPDDKISKIEAQLSSFSMRKKITLRELQSLIGLLNFACSVISPGRAFLRRLIDMSCKVSNPRHFIRLTCEARADIQCWLQFISHFNGKSVFLNDVWSSSDHLTLYTVDAASTQGFAAILGAVWFAARWPDEFKQLHITILELFPIVLAMEMWGSHFQNHKILFLTDNEAVVAIINKTSSKDKTVMK